MNLFILDYDLDKNAEYHIDKHVSKMQLEAAQMLATTIWIDKLLGYVPRKLDSEELGVIKAEMATLPDIDERQFLRYKAAHINHPCTIWMRESYDNFEWTQVYVNALNEEAQYRGYKPHASCVEVNRMPLPTRLPRKGLTKFAQAMPDDYKSVDAVEAYRLYYMMDKADIASWKRRDKPSWWEI
jgi:hypothetical protein